MSWPWPPLPVECGSMSKWLSAEWPIVVLLLSLSNTGLLCACSLCSATERPRDPLPVPAMLPGVPEENYKGESEAERQRERKKKKVPKRTKPLCDRWNVLHLLAWLQHINGKIIHRLYFKLQLTGFYNGAGVCLCTMKINQTCRHCKKKSACFLACLVLRNVVKNIAFPPSLLTKITQ